MIPRPAARWGNELFALRAAADQRRRVRTAALPGRERPHPGLRRARGAELRARVVLHARRLPRLVAFGAHREPPARDPDRTSRHGADRPPGGAAGHRAALPPRPPRAGPAHLRARPPLQRAPARAVGQRRARRRHPEVALLHHSARRGADLARLARVHRPLLHRGGRRDAAGDPQDAIGNARPRRSVERGDGGGARHRRPSAVLGRLQRRDGPRRPRGHAGRPLDHGLSGHGGERAHPLLRGGGDRGHRLDQGRLPRRDAGRHRGHLRQGPAAGIRQRHRVRGHGCGAALAAARAPRPGVRGPVRRRILLLAGALALGAVAFSGDRFWLQFLGKAMIGCILAMSLDRLGLVNPLLTFPVCLLAAAAAALVIGWLSLRATGVYFIMVTLAFTQMLFYLFNDSPALGGSDGLYVAERPVDSRAAAYVAIWAALVLAYLLLARILRAPYGRALEGIRGNEQRMRSLGYPTRRYKLVAFVIAGTLAGVAGYLDATLYGFVNPAQLGWRQSGLILVTVLLGGKGTLYGPALGALLLAFIEHYGERVTEHWNALIAALVIAVVLFLPRGLAGLVQGGRRA